jgi:hypothetical protein
MYGYDHPGDPIGPEPSHQAPDQRAAWHQAFAALGQADQPDVRVLPDGRLWLLRDACTAQTARVCSVTGTPPTGLSAVVTDGIVTERVGCSEA